MSSVHFPIFVRLEVAGKLGDDGFRCFGGTWPEWGYASDPSTPLHRWTADTSAIVAPGLAYDVFRIDALNVSGPVSAVGFAFLNVRVPMLNVANQTQGSLTLRTPVLLPSTTTFGIGLWGAPGADVRAEITMYADVRTVERTA